MILKNKYCQVQALIYVTPDMKERVLTRLTKADWAASNIKSSIFSHKPHKIMASLAACLVLIICLAVTIPLLINPETLSPPVENTVPQVDYESLNDLSQDLGFQLYVPENLPDGYQLETCSLLFGETVQLIYSNGMDEIVFRMTQGNEDMSGDYNEYDEIKIIPTEYGELTLKGNDNLFSIVIWLKDRYSFSLSSSIPLSQEVMVKAAESVLPFSSD